MKLSRSDTDIFVPDELPLNTALTRTTHLAVGAHQDDIEFMAYHGIHECFNKPDKWFTGVILTNGGGSPRSGLYADYSDEQMQAVRRREQRAAALIGGYSCMIQLNHPSSKVKNPADTDTICDLKTIFSAVQPSTVVYLHNPADKHPTHVASVLKSISALRALPQTQRPGKVYGCEVWRSLDWMEDKDKQTLPVDKRPHLAAALSGIFDSQISGGKRYDTAIMGRRIANATFFESHATDETEALSFAIDLTPLIKDETLSIEKYVMEFINRFKDSVADCIRKLNGSI